MAYELPNFQDVPRAVELLEGLNDKQQEAVQALSGAVLVKAGPGSGKTRVLTHRAAALVALGVEPWRILAVTFTNKAAGEMRTRIEALVGEEAALEMWVMTFHSMCARILRVNYALAGLPRGFSIADADDAKAIMRKVLVEGGVEATGKLVTFASKEISLAKNNLIGPNKMAASPDPRVRKLAPFFEAYNVRLRQAGLVDFDDLMVKTLEILVNNPDVAEKYQRRFRYIMIDEYQDTNVPQHRLVNLLAEGHKNIFTVGDFNQCHPGETLVQTSTGKFRIDELDPSVHRLSSWGPSNRVRKRDLFGLPGPRPDKRGYNFEVAEHWHEGEMLTVHTHGPSVQMTPNHRVAFRWSPSAAGNPETAIVYLMKKGDWWRVGKATMRKPTGASFNIGLRSRMAQERGDAAWVLSVVHTQEEALLQEQLLAAKYGLPTATFKSGGGNDSRAFEYFEQLFNMLPDQQERAEKLLADYGLYKELPFCYKSESYMRMGGSTYAQVNVAGNLIPGAMEIPVLDEVSKAAVWMRVTGVDKKQYAGKVYSINVEPFHNYIAGDVIVRNCIYGFRGSSTEAISTFGQDFPGAKIISLEQNYRSTKKIVEVSKALLAAGEAKGQLINLWTDNPEGSPVRLKSFEEADDEAAWVVGEIKAGVKDGTPAGEFAVLYRTNMQSNLLEKALRAAALPYRLVGALRFYERAEIKDVMSYLRIIANPNDELSLARCSGVPRRGIGPTALEAARNNFMARLESGQVVTLVESIRLDLEEGVIKRALAGWQRLLADLDAVELAAMEGPAAAVRAVKGLPGFADAILSKGGEAPEERLGNVDELVSDAAEFERDIPLSVDMEAIREALGDRVELAELVGFLEQVALVTDVESGDGEGGVWLMTAHASKGKEFANVFVVGLEDGLFPHERAEGKEGVEEERRLAFVAFSRAEKTLTLTHAERRMVAGEFQDRRSSPFLKALPNTVQRLARSESTRFSGPDIPRRDRTDAWGSRDIYKSKIFTPTRSFTAVRKAVPKVEVGNTVEHKVFGEGVVTSKNGTTATVQFADRSRLLDLTLAPITVKD